jgi:hypothetical protein
MEVMSRPQFINKVNDIMRNHGVDCADPIHPLWVAEEWHDENNKLCKVKCEYFVCVDPIWDDPIVKRDYWKWVEHTLKGDVICFSSDKRERSEWWGFTHEEDILIWSLKWIK